MKKILNNKVAMFALAVLAIVATYVLFLTPLAGVAMIASFPMIMKFGEVDITVKSEEEKDQLEMLTKIINAITDKAMNGLISKDEMIKAIEDKVAEKGFKLSDDAEFKKFTDAVAKQGEMITAMKEQGGSEVGKSLGQQFKEWMNANKDEVTKAIKANGSMSFTAKNAANMLASTNITTGSVPAPVRDPGLNDVARERKFIMDVIGATSTTSPSIDFVEKVNVDGTVVFVPDTDAFAQIDFDMTPATSSAKDVGAFITVHENMLNDIDFLAGEIDRELPYQIMKAADAGILSGVGTTCFLKGITVYAVAGFSLTTIETPTPNIGDCIAAAMIQVETVGFDEANLIVLNPVDYNNLIGTKDSQGRYVGHPFLSPDGQNFAGVPITRTTFMTAGYMLVGNKMKSNIKVLQGIELAMGYNLTGEFTKRLLTIRGGMRLHHYIKTNDVNSFVYDAIADIKDAITQI